MMKIECCCCCVHCLRCMITSKQTCCIKDILSLEEVQDALISKELNKKFEVKSYGAGDGLVARVYHLPLIREEIEGRQSQGQRRVELYLL